MWNMIFQKVSLLVTLLSFWVLLKGRRSCQSTTMLYVFGHCGKYMLGSLLRLISKSWGGGVSFALLSVGVVCVCMYIGGCLNWHILSLPCCSCRQGSKVFIATLGSIFHWKVLAWLEFIFSQREETTHSLPSMMCSNLASSFTHHLHHQHYPHQQQQPQEQYLALEKLYQV
jgi:hypothetical protein